MDIKNKIFKKILLFAILFSPLFYNSALANLDDWLIWYWNFDQCNFVDSTVIQSNWTPYWSPTCVAWISWNAFKFGWVYDRDFAVIWNTSELTINNNFTFNMWFNIQWELSMDWWWNITPNWMQIILAKAWDRSGVNIWLWKWADWKRYLSASNWRCCTNDNKWIWWKTGFWLNEWHMMTFSNWWWYTRIYLDWKLEAELAETEFMLNPATANQNLQISIWERAYWYPFNWIVDELKIYNRVLDVSEVNKLYSNLTKLNLPTNLNQYVKSPELEETEISTWEKIWKFQSGSGIILRADTDSQESSKLVVDIYKTGEIYPIELSSDFDTNSTKQIVIPYLWTWDYSWQAKIVSSKWAESDFTDFWNNPATETDYSLFEGFEPYPYWYKFANWVPDYSLLTGNYNLTYIPIDWSIHYNKIDWNKWEIMDKVFPLSSFSWWQREYFDAFESLWLSNYKPDIFNWNCFWLALSALTQYSYPWLLSKNFTNFSNNIWSWYIRNNININVDTNNWNTWQWLDDNIKAILSHQLYQHEASYANKLSESIKNDTPIDIINKIKNNPWDYLITFWLKSWCNIFWYNCKEGAHSVIPYKVEWNKIYIWDNNIPYPYIKDSNNNNLYWYSRYIEINTENNTYNVTLYEKYKFWYIWLVSIKDVYSNSTSPIWFNWDDSLYTINWTSNILLIDNDWRKTWYQDGNIYEEIPWTDVLNIANSSSWSENTWKQIYLPKKIDWLTLKVSWNTQENYDLMIAWWDYYTKLSWINTDSWQTDTYNISRENIKIDFDDNKIWTGTYDILVDDFQNNWTWTVYIPKIESQKWLQTLDINWTNVTNNSDNAVKYQADIDNDGIMDISKNTKAIENPQDTNTKKSGISWKINISEDYSTTKKIDKLKYNDIILMLEKEKDEKDEYEEKEWKEKLKDKIKDIFTKRQIVKIKEDWTYNIDNLESWKYKLEIVNDNLMNKVTKPDTWYYELEAKKGFDYINKDFDVIKGYKLKEIKDKLDNLKHK